MSTDRDECVGRCDGSLPSRVPPFAWFRRKRPPLVFQFYPAFKNAKHGNIDGLSKLENELFEALDEDK